MAEERSRRLALAVSAILGTASLVGCTTVTNTTGKPFDEWIRYRGPESGVLVQQKRREPYTRTRGSTRYLLRPKYVDLRLRNTAAEPRCAYLRVKTEGDVHWQGKGTEDGVNRLSGPFWILGSNKSEPVGQFRYGRGKGKTTVKFRAHKAWETPGSKGKYQCGKPDECYITTATCDGTGRSDDCRELTLLRWYRDNVLASTEHGREMIRRYYERGPVIAEAIENHSEGARISRALRTRFIEPAADAVDRGNYDAAYSLYTGMVAWLEERMSGGQLVWNAG